MIMATVTQILVIISGVWLIAVSILMFVSPQSAIRYVGKAASTNLINYSELTLRGIWGIALMSFAEFSKFPQILGVFGVFILVTTAILFLVPRKWHARYAMWCSNNLTAPLVRFLSPLSLAFGVFLIYAVL
jgi:hypothetical protein